MKRTVLKTLPVALSLAFACGAASADAAHDTEGFHGYFRAGAGSSSTHGPQSCYGLGGPTMSYRLGNECDSYAEFGYTKELAKSANGTSWVGTIWANGYTPSSNIGDAKLGINKAYIEAKNLPFMNGATVWVGRRFYFRPDIHFLDLQYINLNGDGAGIDQLPVGPGKLSYAVFKDKDKNIIDPVTNTKVDSTAALRQNLVYEGLPVNPDGTVDAALTLIHAEGEDNTHNGWQLSVFHKQNKVLGGGNTFGVQYGVGPGTGIGVGNLQMGASGDTLLGSDVKRTRVFNELVMQPTKQFSMEIAGLWQRDKSDAMGNNTWTTVGARPVYAFTENFKLQAELGVTRLKSSLQPDTARLTKLTIAPTIAVAEDYWSRPELRLFVTHARWNDASTALVNAFNNSGPVYGNNTSGTSVGVQVEAWF
ncbi:MAG: carbohydrate porin [Pseudomonadota bacterium]